MQITGDQTPEPLVRSRTTADGQGGVIEVNVVYNNGTIIPDGEGIKACVTTFVFNVFGAELKFPPNGTGIPNADVLFEAGAGMPDLVKLVGGDGKSVNATTNADGIARINVVGAGQEMDIPSNYIKTSKHYSINVSSRPEEIDWKSGVNFFWDLFLSLVEPINVLKPIVDLLKGLHWQQTPLPFVVQDWRDPCIGTLSPSFNRLNGLPAPLAGEVCVDSWSGTFSTKRVYSLRDWSSATETVSGTVTWGRPVFSPGIPTRYSLDNLSATITIDQVVDPFCTCHGQLDIGMSELEGSDYSLGLDPDGSYFAHIFSGLTINMNCSGTDFCVGFEGGPHGTSVFFYTSTDGPWTMPINGRMQGNYVLDWGDPSNGMLDTFTTTWDFGR
jgi:hypothetical protein